MCQLYTISCISKVCKVYPAGIYLLKVNNRKTRTRCEICSKLTIKTPERRHWRRSGVFIVNFEHISDFVLVFRMLTLNLLLLIAIDHPIHGHLVFPIQTTVSTFLNHPQVLCNIPCHILDQGQNFQIGFKIKVI